MYTYRYTCRAAAGLAVVRLHAARRAPTSLECIARDERIGVFLSLSAHPTRVFLRAEEETKRGAIAVRPDNSCSAAGRVEGAGAAYSPLASRARAHTHVSEPFKRLYQSSGLCGCLFARSTFSPLFPSCRAAATAAWDNASDVRVCVCRVYREVQPPYSPAQLDTCSP